MAMTEINIEYLLSIQEKYNNMIERKKQLNKLYISKWRENIDEDDFKQRRKLANKKYAEKVKAKRIEQNTKSQDN